MKSILCTLLCTLFVFTAAAQKIAIFDEPGFPNASSRNAEFYRNVLNGKILNLKQIKQDLKNYDTLIFPHGGYVPAEAETAVYQLMRCGGTVIICGDIQEPPPAPPVRRPYTRNLATIQFEKKYGMAHGGPLTLVDGRWIVKPVGGLYEIVRGDRWYDCFAISGWPNYAQCYAPNYMRFFDQPLYLNPALKKSGLPPVIQPPAVKRKGKKMMIARLRPEGNVGDYALDIFHPLYQFKTPSGRPYRPFNMAGKSEEDRASDGFIYRKYRPDMFGATLVVMGKTGRMQLDSAQGADVIRKIVKLSKSHLPGGFAISYIKRVHALEKAMQDYNLLNADLTSALKNLAVKNHPSGTHHQQLIRLKSLRAEFTRFNNQFDGMMMQKDQRKVISSAMLNSLSSALKKAIPRLQAELKPVKKYVEPADFGNATHPQKRFTFMTSKFGPWDVSDDANWKKVQSLGVSVIAINATNWEKLSKLNKKFGFFTNYIAIPMHRSHPDKKRVSSGVFNPASGTVRKVNARVWQEKAPDIDPSVKHNLEWANKCPGVGLVIHGDERDFQWSLWGDYMLGLFRKYLAGKYKNISALNREYNAKYTSFDKIMLPLKKPDSQTEHALWEDWTRYREIYRQNNELARWVNMIKKHAPAKQQWLYGSYHLQPRHPANGINYYETGKWLDPATLESSTNPRKEVMTYDIATFGKKHINPEWAGFYYAAGSRLANMNRMREFLWNEANCGTIGWHTFMGGVQTRSKWTQTPLITPNGYYQPEGIALRDTARELNAARKFFLDGSRVEPEVRYVYSPTTRRHTSWPGIEDDLSYQCVTGYNEAFKALHIPARAVDEQAVWEGRLPRECRYLIVPSVEYMNRKLLTSLKKYMQQGGIVIATADSGKFDEYGHKKESLLELAGVRAKKTTDPEFAMFPPDKLEILFPQETSVLMKHPDGSAAATVTKIGKGKLIICGYAIGREYNNTGKGLNTLQKLIGAVGISRPFICNDSNLVIRPWKLNGELYLACYYIHRDTVPVVKGDFPLRSAPVMIPFTINVSGKVTATDLLTGTSLKTVRKGADTLVTGLIGNPGGCIIKLSNANLPKRVLRQTQPVRTGTAVAEEKIFKLPASGQFFAEWRKIKLGRYTLTLAAENDGAWQGKVFATLSNGDQILKRQCISNGTTYFRFHDKTVIFKCKNAQSVMPVNVIGTFTEVDNKAVNGCRIDMPEGKIILQNSNLYAVILPEFGGRISELRLSPESPNQLYLDEKAISEGMGKAYRDYGGIEYNPGAYQGAGWQIPYKVTVLKKSAREILLRLNRSGKYSLPRGGDISYEIFYRMTADSPFLETTVRLYNEMDSEAALHFRTHPEFVVGGVSDVQDFLSWATPAGVRNLKYRPGYNQYFPNTGNWFAMMDSAAGEGVLQTFDAKRIPRLYLCSGRVFSNVELHFTSVRVKPGKFAEFKFSTAVLSGLSRLNGLADTFAFEWNTVQPGVKILGMKKQTIDCKLTLSKGGKVIGVNSGKLQLQPGKLNRLNIKTKPLTPGRYVLQLKAGNKIYTEAFTVEAETDGPQNRELLELQQQYRKTPTPALRRKIFELSGK